MRLSERSLLSLQNLEDGMNHGIYCPPVNGRAGKYLDEERYLGEYNLQEDTVLHVRTTVLFRLAWVGGASE